MKKIIAILPNGPSLSPLPSEESLTFPRRKPTVNAFLSNSDHKSPRSRADIITSRPSSHRRRSRRKDEHRLNVVARLRRLPFRPPLPPPLHIPQEKPEEESDCLLLELQFRQVPRGAAQLHRRARPGPACMPASPALPSQCSYMHISLGQTKTTKAHEHLLRVHQRAERDPPLHGRRRARARHPQGGLDRPVRPAGRPARLHPPRRADGARGQGREEPAVLAGERAGVLALPEGGEGPAERVYVPGGAGGERAEPGARGRSAVYHQC